MKGATNHFAVWPIEVMAGTYSPSNIWYLIVIVTIRELYVSLRVIIFFQFLSPDEDGAIFTDSVYLYHLVGIKK